MQKELFDLNFDNWKVVLFTFIPAAINIGIFIYVSVFFPKNRTNGAFYIFVLLLGLWQIGEGFTRTSISSENALEWYRISGAPSLFMLPFGLLFTIRFIGFHKKINDIFLFLFLFLPAIIFEMCIIARLDKYIIIKSELWNWIVNPEPSAINRVMYFWMTLAALIMLGLFWLHFFKTKQNKTIRTKSFLLAVGFTIPVVGGVITEVIFPLIIQRDSIPLTTTLMTIFSIAALITIKKYNMLDYSPRHQWNEIIESMNEGVLIVNNKGQIKYANKTFCEITGYEFGEMEGKIAYELFLNNDEQKEYIYKVMKNRNKKLSNQYEMQLKTKSGEKVWMLINGSPYMDINGNVVGSIGIHTNINHLKETETRLIDKMNELKIFFYKASHDLRSPATTIQGLINLHKSGKEKNIETLFSFIEKSNYQSLMIVDEISLIASILQHTIEATETDLECEIKKIIQKINPCDSPFEFEINVDIDTNFSTDKKMLIIILRNIFDNAMKYRDFKKQICLAKISCYRNNDNVEIKIADNGQGIPEKMQDKIFDLFSKSTTSSLGLGLYIAKCAAEKIDGSITMKSKERQGTEFTICIPNKI